MGNNFVNFHTDQGILPHPLDLPSQRGEAVQAFSFVGKINGNDVRSTVGDTSEAAKADPGEKFATLAAAELSDKHETPRPQRSYLRRLH
jgi:hypothetical protein